MGCCGDKRAQFREETRSQSSSSPSQTADAPDTKEYKPKTFEYTGKRSLKIRGSMTGDTYYFRFPGHRLDVAHEDSFAMMGEGDLRVVSHTDD